MNKKKILKDNSNSIVLDKNGELNKKLFNLNVGPIAKLDNEAKINIIKDHFKVIMETLGMDLSNNSIKDTPLRVAKMYVNEVFSGLDLNNKPKISLFENESNYNNMLLIKDINFQSTCEHHFMPMIGKAHVAYFPQKKIIGLSKINRIVDYFARRPQLQERATNQICEDLKNYLKTDDIAVAIDAVHLCVVARGISDQNSSTISTNFSGIFLQKQYQDEFFVKLYKS